MPLMAPIPVQVHLSCSLINGVQSLKKHAGYLLLAGWVSGLGMISPAFAHLEGNTPPPGCQLSQLDGAPAQDWAAHKGEVIYIDFWASWCPPCVRSFPFMNQLVQDFGERGLQVVGVNLDEKLSDAQQFLARIPAEFSVVVDADKQCAVDFGVIAMPSTYIIDKKGLVRHIHHGFRPGEAQALRDLIEALLAENS